MGFFSNLIIFKVFEKIDVKRASGMIKFLLKIKVWQKITAPLKYRDKPAYN
jgi:hypothetical protein